MNKNIRLFFKRMVPKELVRKYRDISVLIKWNMDGRPDPAPDSVKQRIVKRIGKKNKLKTFIETGTAGGLMIKSVKNKFSRIISIELYDVLFNNAKKMFSKYKHITLVQGDSGERLSEILPSVNEPALFWLDAHYSGNGTARGNKDTPIIKELHTIFSRKNKGDVILIDDTRCFDGTHDYPKLQEIIDLVSQYDHLTFRIERDIMIIEPNR